MLPSSGESRVKLLQEELAEQKTVHLSLKAEIERHVNKEFQLKQQVQQLEQDYELSIHYVRSVLTSEPIASLTRPIGRLRSQ
jgi:hypothetical protein